MSKTLNELRLPMGRPSRDEIGLLLARTWSLRGTCGRRRVGCVLMNARGEELSTGYNGPPTGRPHCLDTGGEHDRACAGRMEPSGTNLHLCEAIHAESNALMRCRDIWSIDTCYCTASPCDDCVKLLLGTSCRRIVFAEEYPHAQARQRWTEAGREWVSYSPDFTITWLDPR
jgi:dCMP deaminase